MVARLHPSLTTRSSTTSSRAASSQEAQTHLSEPTRRRLAVRARRGRRRGLKSASYEKDDGWLAEDCEIRDVKREGEYHKGDRKLLQLTRVHGHARGRKWGESGGGGRWGRGHLGLASLPRARDSASGKARRTHTSQAQRRHMCKKKPVSLRQSYSSSSKYGWRSACAALKRARGSYTSMRFSKSTPSAGSVVATAKSVASHRGK